MPKAIALSPEELKRFEGRYQTDSPAHWGGVIDRDAPTKPKPVVVTAEGKGLWIDLGWGAKRRFIPLSPVEFFDRDTMGPARFIFIENEEGRVVGVEIKGSGPILSTKGTKLP